MFAAKTIEECLPHLEAVREVIANYNIQLRNQDSRPRTTSRGDNAVGRPGPAACR